jgi:hypothetical protein
VRAPSAHVEFERLNLLGGQREEIIFQELDKSWDGLGAKLDKVKGASDGLRNKLQLHISLPCFPVFRAFVHARDEAIEKAPILPVRLEWLVDAELGQGAADIKPNSEDSGVNVH